MLNTAHPMKIRRQDVLRLLVSIGVSLLILGFMVHSALLGGPEALRHRLLPALRDVLPGFVMLYFAFSLFQAFFRAVRYRLLIAAAREPDVPALHHTFLVTLARNMLVDLLPGRLGELSYIAMMNKGYRVSGRACVSSLGISFVFDFVALIVLVAGLAALQIFTSGLEGWIIGVLAMLLVAVVVMLASLFLGIRIFARWLQQPHTALQRLPGYGKLAGFTAELADAVDFTRNARVLHHLFGLSLLVRLGKYAGLFFLFHAVVRPSFPAFAAAPPLSILFALVGAEAGASLPVPAFMSFGTYEAGGLLALTLLGFSAGVSTVVMLALHIWSQLIDYALGGIGFVTFLFTTSAQTQPDAAVRPAWQRRWAVACAVLFLAAGVAVFGLQLRAVRRQGAQRPPGAGQPAGVPAEAIRSLESLLNGRAGFVVWSSNRYGTHDILRMTLPNRRITRLTSHPHVDYFARISPDGTRVVFSRSQVPWVSQRNPHPWDVYLYDLRTGEERRVATNGNTPTWAQNGEAVCFQRDGGAVVLHRLADGHERVLFEAGASPVPDGIVLQTPSLRPGGLDLAVTYRGRRRGTFVLREDGGVQAVAGGCQLVWTPDGDSLLYVERHGRQNTVYQFDPVRNASTPWLQLPGAYSHVYFPQVANTGDFIVLGASAGGHEHDQADYEIFLWKIGTAPEDAVRLTFHTGNDCWPDLFLEGNRGYGP